MPRMLTVPTPGEMVRAMDAVRRLSGTIEEYFASEEPLVDLTGAPATEANLMEMIDRLRDWTEQQPGVRAVVSVERVDQDPDYRGSGWDVVLRVVYFGDESNERRLFHVWVTGREALGNGA